MFEDQKAGYDNEGECEYEKHDEAAARFDGHAGGRVVENMPASNIFRPPTVKEC